MEKNYHGVEITKSWTLVAFAKEFGTPKFATCKNKETGEEFKCLAFEAENGDLTFAHFGYSTEGMTPAEIKAQKDDIKVGLSTSGKYSVYKQDGGRETIDIW